MALKWVNRQYSLGTVGENACETKPRLLKAIKLHSDALS